MAVSCSGCLSSRSALHRNLTSVTSARCFNGIRSHSWYITLIADHIGARRIKVLSVLSLCSILCIIVCLVFYIRHISLAPYSRIGLTHSVLCSFNDSPVDSRKR